MDSVMSQENINDGVLKPSIALTKFEPSRKSFSVTQESRQERMQYGLMVQSIGLLLSEGVIGEVVQNLAICPFPNSAAWFTGVINMRGNLVPVYDLTLLLGLGEKSNKAQMILVLGRGEDAVGVLIESLPQRVDTSLPIEQRPALPDQLSGHTGQTFLYEDTLWFEFDHRSFFKQLAGKEAA
jgi:twitching motility protein PilI